MASLDINSVWRALATHTPPTGACAEGWCFDQLLGAAFALQQAYELGPPGQNPEKRYRPEPRLLADEQSEAYKQFGWNFYLNSGIHRVVWTCERLLRFVAEKDSRSDMFHNVIAEAEKKTAGRRALKRVLAHFPKNRIVENEAYRSQPVTHDNVLHILRGRVNRQKHFAGKAAGPTAGAVATATGQPWNKTPPKEQYALLLHALKLLIDLFWEQYSVGWRP